MTLNAHTSVSDASLLFSFLFCVVFVRVLMVGGSRAGPNVTERGRKKRRGTKRDGTERGGSEQNRTEQNRSEHRSMTSGQRARRAVVVKHVSGALYGWQLVWIGSGRTLGFESLLLLFQVLEFITDGQRTVDGQWGKGDILQVRWVSAESMA